MGLNTEIDADVITKTLPCQFISSQWRGMFPILGQHVERFMSRNFLPSFIIVEFISKNNIQW